MIYITGDTHGDFKRFSTRSFTATEEDIVLICGDFGGVWDGSKEEQYWLDWLNKKPYNIAFVDGNHEGYDLLNSYPIVEWRGGKTHEIRSNIHHLMRGEVFDFEGKKFFAFGGARSHDIKDGILEKEDKIGIKNALSRGLQFRVNHVSWWKEEMPNEEEMIHGYETLKKYDGKVDYIITHCLPTQILKCRWWWMESDELTRYFDSLLVSDLQFTKWYCGHYHYEDQILGKYNILYENIIRIL